MPRSSDDETDIFETSSETSSSKNGEGDQLIGMDFEHHGEDGGASRPRTVLHLWKVPLPARRGHLVSDLVKSVALLLTLLCIAQFVYIIRLKDGFRRVPNDPYDRMFGREINRDGPSIWDSDRQSFLHNVVPVPVHSHNDYWRRIPLFEAVASGCISVEADVHLRSSDLLVGHKARDLNDHSTLRSMYLEPLQRMIEAQNIDVPDGTWRGIFDLAPQQTLILLIDHKTSGPETFAELHRQLQPLRDLDYLTYWNGTDRVMRQLTIVASGNAPFHSITALEPTHRDIFWDAKLEQLTSAADDFDVEPVVYKYNLSNSYVASTEFRNAQFYIWPNGTAPWADTPRLKDIAATQYDQARARGLMARYYGTPAEPPNLRDIVWKVLVECGVGLMNMDDMGAVRDRANGWGRIQP